MCPIISVFYPLFINISPEQLLRMNEAFDAIKRYSDSFGRDISASGVHLVNENGFYIFCLPVVSQGPVY